jgi:hypothetical protein
MHSKVYIGDGVYADYDGFAIILTTENGISISNTIVLEPEVYNSLLLYVGRVTA